jgi:SagB-type dehydrogenase family enzyme
MIAATPEARAPAAAPPAGPRWHRAPDGTLRLEAPGVSLVLSSAGTRRPWRTTEPPARHELHPHITARRVDDALELRHPGAGWWLRLQGCGIGDGCFGGEPPGSVEHSLATMLWRCRLSAAPAAHEAGPLQRWGLEDLAFHAASRGRADRRARGATYRFGTALPGTHAVATTAPLTPARADDWARLQGVPLAQVLAARRSIRGAVGAVSGEALEQLLRLAFADIVSPATDGMPCRARAYSSAGGMHEIEPFVLAHAVQGLAPGLHRFDIASGRLHAQPQPPTATAAAPRMLEAARAAWGEQQGLPRALIVLAADVPLLNWRYEGIAYRLALLNAGHASALLLQLGAALGIGLCALGSGDAEAFAQASGIDEWALPAVAEIAVAGATAPCNPCQEQP